MLNLTFQLILSNMTNQVSQLLPVKLHPPLVKNKRSRLKLFLFSLLIFIFFLIYFLLFYFQNQGQSDKIMLSHSRSHQMTQSQVTQHIEGYKRIQKNNVIQCVIHMVIQGRLEIACMDHQVFVYKVDNPVQSSLSSSLVLTQYKVLFIDQL